MMKPKIRSKPILRYAKTVYNAIWATKTENERKKAISKYYDVSDYAAAA